MRRLAKIFSWLCLLAALVVVLAIWGGVSFYVVLPDAVAPAGAGTPVVGGTTPGAAFPGFPLDQPRTIDFDLDELTMGQLNERERIDQKRDWLLMTVAADSGASAEMLSRGLYDLATVRHGYMHQVAHFDYGTTRFCCLDGGKTKNVIALVPRANDAGARGDDLAHIFDEVRKNLGVEPTQLEIFEYVFDSAAQATVTRRADIPGGHFLEPAAGYHEASVSSAAELGAFLASVDDLVQVALEDNGRVRLGGRKLARSKYQNITLEDVAAIWQAEKQIQGRLAEIKAKWDARFAELNAHWSGMPSNYANQAAFDAEGAKLQREYEDDVKQSHAVAGSGFSLDPSYDFAGLADVLSARKVSQVFAAIDEHPQATPKPKKGQHAESEEDEQDFAALAREAGISSFELDTAIGALRGKRAFDIPSVQDMLRNKAAPAPTPDPVPFLKIVDELRQQTEKDNSNVSATELYWLCQEVLLKYRFQAARYDGPLNGTEVGMTLFYTDLMAKLWGHDHMGSAPSSMIPGFKPQTRNILPTVYRNELQKLPNTRLWFGPEDRGYQIVGRAALRFARNATRIYAASSNELQPGKEVAPNAPAEAFLGWWNDHYEEVAQYEPQYQRLNEIMKWSLLISWLNNDSQGARLAALADVPVNHGNWFPDWAANNRDLRYHDWKNVRFFEHNHLGAQTETMPILVSYNFVTFADESKDDPAWRLEGGVSLGSKDLFHARAAIAEDLPAMVRRSDLDYSQAAAKPNELVNLRGTHYEFEPLETTLREVSSVTASRDVAALETRAKDGLKYRARYGEMREGKFARTILREPEGAMRVEASAATGEIGQLEVAPSKNGFRVGWRASEVEDGYALGRKLSASPDFGATLKGDPSVEFAVADPDTGIFYVKTYGTGKKWLKFARETTPTPDVMPGWDGRVADLTPKAEPVNIGWLDEAKLPRTVTEGGQWVRGPPPPPGPPATEVASFDDSVQRIVADPMAYKKALDAEFAGGLQDIDHLLASNQPRRALAAVENGLGRFGDNEQLRLRQAFAELADRRPGAAAEALDDIRLDPARPREEALALLDEVNARLKAGSHDAGLLPMAESLDWRTSALKPPGDTVQLAADGTGKLSPELHTGSFAETASPVDPRAVPDGALLYFQDNPRLNNLDWNGSVKGSLDQIASHDLGSVVELPRADIAHFQPSSIQTPQAKFSRAGAATNAPRYRAAQMTGYRVWSGAGANNGSDDDDDDPDGPGQPSHHHHGKVFIVLAK